MSNKAPKKKLVFWDHAFHKKTKSSFFLKELLKERYDLVDFWDYTWHDPKRKLDISKVNAAKPDCIIFWQMLPPPPIMSRLGCQNKVWVPMFDTFFAHRDYSLKYVHDDLKVISFCKLISEKIGRLWPHILSLQYFPSPFIGDYKKKHTGKFRILFWQRVNKINWKYVKKLIDPNQIEVLFFRNHMDSEHAASIPGKRDMLRYKIKLIGGWLKKEEYIKLLKSCDILMAPRPLEGLGLTFLEAMACGVCVVSPDNPTANEYIVSGHNGILYDPREPGVIDLSNANTLGFNALESTRKGHARWKKDSQKIYAFIEKH